MTISQEKKMVKMYLPTGVMNRKTEAKMISVHATSNQLNWNHKMDVCVCVAKWANLRLGERKMDLISCELDIWMWIETIQWMEAINGCVQIGRWTLKITASKIIFIVILSWFALINQIHLIWTGRCFVTSDDSHPCTNTKLINFIWSLDNIIIARVFTTHTHTLWSFVWFFRFFFFCKFM